MVKKIGAITIGQSPRVDVVPEITGLMGRVEIVECGALDGLTNAQIAAMAPKEQDYVLVTRLRDGSSVKISETYILARMQAQIDRLVAEEGAEGILLLCSGEFPAFTCTKPLLYPQTLLQRFVTTVAQGKKLGVMTPDQDQVAQVRRRWNSNGIGAVVAAAGSPYGPQEKIWEAAETLKSQGAEMIVLDCIGFNQFMKEEIKRITGVPVILPRTVAARAVAELFG